jgi:5-deoxy-5-amino-3-dehydroquinate synthase
VNFHVHLGDRSYDVTLRDGARHDLADLVARRAPRAQRSAIVATASVVTHPWFDLRSGVDQSVVVIPDGESAKTPQVVAELVEDLAARGLSRDDVVIGVGGGAATDVAGFAAAVYLRGVPLIQVPTTVAAQVDAAIGGKTGVNLRAGKNLMGAVHQPLGVLCDTETLATLPERERRAGLGEVAKCWLLDGRTASQIASAGVEEMFGVAIALKVRVVSEDERESGPRALLNYGHTLAHALETWWYGRDPDRLRHGEAVAVGVAFAVRLARAMDRVGDDVVAEHDAVLDALGLDHALPSGTDLSEMVELMARDKKARHDLTFVLADPSGFNVVRGVDPMTVEAVLKQFQGES